MVIRSDNHCSLRTKLPEKACGCFISLKITEVVHGSGRRRYGGSRKPSNKRSKDQISQTAHLGLQSCLWLIWSSDPGYVS